MPTNPRSDCVSLLRTATTQIMEAYAAARKLRQRAEILTGGAGFAPADFAGTNADLTPDDYAALRGAYDALESVLVDATGKPTASLVALTRWSNNPTV